VSADGYVVAVDAGTGSCRAALFSATGELRALAAEEWAHPPEPGVPGGRRFDCHGNWELVTACLRQAVAGIAPDAVRAVATTSFRGGLALFDAAGNVLWACPNGDARAGAEARVLVESGAAAAMQARGGDWVSLTAPARLAWVRRNEPELWRRVARVGLINDWLVQRLTGTLVSDPSVGSSSGLFDLARRSWSPDSLAICDLDAGQMPPLATSGTVVGELRAPGTGLRPGTPVVMGGADTALGLVGLGVADTDRCVALGGTHWQQSLTVGEPRLDRDGRLRTLCHALPDQWLVEGIGFHCGLALRWFRDAFYAGDGYDAIDRDAASVPPGAGGVVAVLANEMNARSWVHAAPAFVGFDLERPRETGRAAFARAILESAAFVVRAHVERLETIAGRTFPTLLLAGGVARSGVWPQVIAAVLGRPVEIADRSEATVRGAALAATVGAGWHADLAAAARSEPDAGKRTVAPDSAAAATYAELYPRWREVYARLLPATAGGLLAPLWAAPGT
jgi:autoinducer 2 (AI-2) kinase